MICLHSSSASRSGVPGAAGTAGTLVYHYATCLLPFHPLGGVMPAPCLMEPGRWDCCLVGIGSFIRWTHALVRCLPLLPSLLLALLPCFRICLFLRRIYLAWCYCWELPPTYTLWVPPSSVCLHLSPSLSFTTTC